MGILAIADVADHSVLMLEIVNLLSTGILAIVSSEPTNSTVWFKTSVGNRPHRATITSFPVTPGGKVPVRVT